MYKKGVNRPMMMDRNYLKTLDQERMNARKSLQGNVSERLLNKSIDKSVNKLAIRVNESVSHCEANLQNIDEKENITRVHHFNVKIVPPGRKNGKRLRTRTRLAGGGSLTKERRIKLPALQIPALAGPPSVPVGRLFPGKRSYIGPNKKKIESKISRLSTTNKRCGTPRVYKIKDIYQQKQEERLRVKLEEERKAREFRSRPAPKFDNFLSLSLMKKPKMGNKKRRKRFRKTQQQYTHTQVQSDDDDVLRYDPPPYVPTTTEPRPFKFHVDRRLEERKKYDAAVQEATEQKLRAEARKKQKEDQKIHKALRKLTRFKAQPNPFKPSKNRK